MRRLLLLCMVGLSMTVTAQKNAVWGYLRDSVTHEPIALASVTNLNTKKTVMTSGNGLFRIEISANQLLSFAAVGYHFDTVLYNIRHLPLDTITLYLSPLAHSLGNVTVTAKGMNSYQLDSIERRNFFLQGRPEYKLPTVSNANYGAGIALNLDRFSRHEKEKRKSLDIFYNSENEAYINYRFSPALVTEYTGLKGDSLQDFMQRYRPGAEWLRKHTSEEDMKYYLNDKLKLYFKK